MAFERRSQQHPAHQAVRAAPLVTAGFAAAEYCHTSLNVSFGSGAIGPNALRVQGEQCESISEHIARRIQARIAKNNIVIGEANHIWKQPLAVLQWQLAKTTEGSHEEMLISEFVAVRLAPPPQRCCVRHLALLPTAWRQ